MNHKGNPKRLFRMAAACALAAIGGGRGRAATRNQAEQLESVVRHYQEAGYFNGAVLVADGGKIIYERGVGSADFETRTPNTPLTRFGIGSITKQFTAVLVLQEIADGKLRLDGTVSEYLRWYRRDNGQRMTIEQLLRHTSGSPGDFDQPEFSAGAAAAQFYAPDDFAVRFCQKDLTSQPGTTWNYSNCGYILLGLILEQVSHQKFPALLQQRLLDPIGMKNTGLLLKNFSEMQGAVGYKRHVGARYTRGPYLDLSHIFSAGAMYSTVEDLFLWNHALTSSPAIPTALREQIFRPGKNNWAYGWFVTRMPEGTSGAGSMMAEMRGDMTDNFFAWILRYPERDAVIIVLRNSYESTEHLEENLQAVLFGQPPRLPRRQIGDILIRPMLAHKMIVVALVCAALALWLVRGKEKRHE